MMTEDEVPRVIEAPFMKKFREEVGWRDYRIRRLQEENLRLRRVLDAANIVRGDDPFEAPDSVREEEIR